jgi:hypothetical protein
MTGKTEAVPDWVFQKQNWSASDPIAVAWINETIWRLMCVPDGRIAEIRAMNLPIEAFESCRRSLMHNGMQGFLPLTYGDRLKEALGEDFYEMIELDARRSELFEEELHWLLGPRLAPRMIVIGDYLANDLYGNYADASQNPRLMRRLMLWTPTLAAREEAGAVLKEGGYDEIDNKDMHVFRKATYGLTHYAILRGSLWEHSKNWSAEVEREIWDRASTSTSTVSPKLETTDLFLVLLRSFAIDTLLSGGVELLDLATLLERKGEEMDWDRLRQTKNLFLKPDWFWAAFMALEIFEARTNRRLKWPNWVSEGLQEAKTSTFWPPFIESRLCWAGPDGRYPEFSRAYVKLARGT